MRWLHRQISRRIRSTLFSGLFVSFLTLSVSALLVIVLMHFVDLPDWFSSFLLYTCHVIAIFLGTVHTTVRQKKRGLFNGLRISFGYGLLIWLISSIVFSNPLHPGAFVLFGLALSIGCASGVWTMQQLEKAKR